MAKQRQIDRLISDTEQEIARIRAEADQKIEVQQHVLQRFLRERAEQDAKRKPKEKARTMRLALAIQQAVEDWMEDEAETMRERDAHDDEQRSLRRYTDAERERI